MGSDPTSSAKRSLQTVAFIHLRVESNGMARLPPHRYTSPWGDTAPCPCGARRKSFDCCKRAKQLPYFELPGLPPPGAVTNYQHPACYMSSTNNCSDGKSREHYVSEAILDLFDQLNVSGMPWQKPGESKILPANALVAISSASGTTARSRLST